MNIPKSLNKYTTAVSAGIDALVDPAVRVSNRLAGLFYRKVVHHFVRFMNTK